MNSLLKTVSLPIFFVSGLSAWAGSTCMGETYSGKLVKLELSTVGTFGSFSSAELTVTDANGAVLLSNKNTERSAQFAELMRGEKAWVVYSDMASDFDIVLNYVGTDFSDLQWKKNIQLEQVLKDPSRKKEAGNRLDIDSYLPELPSLHLTDIVCSLDHDV